MWLKNFQFNDKTLSDVELLVLANLTDQEFVEPATLMEQLDRKFAFWQPERGTIYPLLHRLTSQNLLEREKDGRNIKFRRTERANTFLSSLISSKSLVSQFHTTTAYLAILASSMIEIDPFGASNFLDEFQTMLSDLSKSISEYQLLAQAKIKDDNWVEIDIDLE